MKIFKFGDNLACVIPKNMAKELQLKEGGEADFFEVKPGIYLFVNKEKVEEMLNAAVGEEPQKLLQKTENGQFISREEQELLKKLDAIKFSERIPYNVNKAFSREEKQTLSGLVRRGIVHLYKGGKYEKTGVYDIPQKFYHFVKEANVNEADVKEVKKEEVVEPPTKLPPIEQLDKNGYLIVEYEGEAKNISQALEKRIKGGEIIGTRGFDKRFYVARSQLFYSLHEKICKLLSSGPKNIADLKNTLKVPEEACKVVLEIMNEQGDVIEKKKGNYELI